MSYYDLFHLNHHKQLSAALGNMVIAWAYAESALCATLARITKMHIDMATLGYYRIPTFEARTKFLQALIQEWETVQYDKEAISKEIDRLVGNASARNDWVHGVWCCTEDQTEVVVFDYRRPVGKRRKPVKAADVRNHNEAVLRHAKTLMRLVDRKSMSPDGEPTF